MNLPGDKYILIELITNVWPYVFLFQPQVSNSELLCAIVLLCIKRHNLVTFDNNHFYDRSAWSGPKKWIKLGWQQLFTGWMVYHPSHTWQVNL